MAMQLPLSIPLSTAGAAGKGSVSVQVPPNERWHVALVSVTSASLTVQVARNSPTVVIDSTAADPRPTATSNSEYDLDPGETLIITWAAGGGVAVANGQQLVAVITGTRTVG